MLLRWQPDMQENRSGNPAVILVVDDEAHIVRVVAFKLRSAGFEVIEAFDGEEAWDRLEESRVDLVLTDRQMPILDGIELARRIASNPRTTNLPVIMLTARGFRLTPSELSDAGIVEMIDKPFSPRGLVERIEEVLADRNAGEAAA
ncbi:MAG: response regulator [Phycisphaerae bacterium]|nr:response regulator [Phycisphaerae bacterium]